MNCHTNIHPQSEKLEVVRSSYETGLSIPWVRVHDLADYAFFNHSAHVRRGVGCVECHGRVDKMEVVYQTEPLSMGWCLDCHRNPEGRLRDPSRVTDMTWEPKEGEGAAVMQALNLHPNEDCSTCHR